ncbi:flavodoxin domain-containing protein [Candidatus Saccharibacteria bacterium]|nr:flavodoxin domain-containing protein [Candidatus Saccharibacteria bacterium]
MNIAVRYHSRGGNTKAVAGIIAQVVGVEAKSVSEPLEQPVDLLFVGAPVYAMMVDSSLKNFVRGLDTNMVKKIAAFSTAGSHPTAISVIKRIAAERNIPVCEETFFLKMGLLKHGGKLADEQVAQARDFAKRIVESQ